MWLVGFTDGAGSFYINKLNGSLYFNLSQNSYNLKLLYFIKRQLGVGQIFVDKNEMAHYRIRDHLTIEKVIFPIFDKYPLLTTKYYNYLKFKEAYFILTDNFLSFDDKNILLFKNKEYLIQGVTLIQSNKNYLILALNNYIIRLYKIKENLIEFFRFKDKATEEQNKNSKKNVKNKNFKKKFILNQEI